MGRTVTPFAESVSAAATHSSMVVGMATLFSSNMVLFTKSRATSVLV